MLCSAHNFHERQETEVKYILLEKDILTSIVVYQRLYSRVVHSPGYRYEPCKFYSLNYKDFCRLV